MKKENYNSLITACESRSKNRIKEESNNQIILAEYRPSKLGTHLTRSYPSIL